MEKAIHRAKDSCIPNNDFVSYKGGGFAINSYSQLAVESEGQAWIPESHALFVDLDKVLDLIKRKDLAFTPTSG